VLVAIDGVDGAASLKLAKRLAAERGHQHATISRWDMSGIFHDLNRTGAAAGRQASARTLLLLYAADLAFRLKWEIRPALAEGRMVLAVPYVQTAVALGRAAGVDRRWVQALFAFAPPADHYRRVDARSARTGRSGFVEFASRRMSGLQERSGRRTFIERARTSLKAARGKSGP
jgi:hypothetical protein